MKKLWKYFGTKKNLIYPKLFNIRQNQNLAKLLYDNFAGEKGELTAVTQYIYEHIELKRYEDFSRILLNIAIEEMHHLELIGGLIKRLGGKAYFVDSNQFKWNSKYVKYHFNSLYDMLNYNIKSEKEAIAGYEDIMKYTNNKSIKDLLERIIIDEKTHLEIFNRIK